jgi:hypothetical protein
MCVQLHLWTTVISFNSLISWLVLWSHDTRMEYFTWHPSIWNAVKKELCSNTYRFKILQLFHLCQMFVMVSPQMILCNLLIYTTYLNSERRTVTDFFCNFWMCGFYEWCSKLQKTTSRKPQVPSILDNRSYLYNAYAAASKFNPHCSSASFSLFY